MERLTKRKIDGVDGSIIIKRNNKYMTACEAVPGINAVIIKLAHYEDTGLTPDEVAALKSERDAAVNDIYKIRPCLLCANSKVIGDRQKCVKCDFEKYIENENIHFQWRGAGKRRND